MLTTLVTVHVLVCLFIIAVVLLQVNQQANIGSMFGGGSSQTVFGSGTQTALGKATTAAIVMFFLTCLAISFVVEKDRSVIKRSETLQEQVQEKVEPKEERAPGAGPLTPGSPAASKASPVGQPAPPEP